MPESGALRTLLARARDVRTSDDVASVLTEVADYAAHAAGMGFAVIDLHRPQWNDFETVAVAGAEEIRTALLNTTTQWVFWAPKLAPQFSRGAVQHVAPGDGPGAALTGPWQAGEVLFAVMRGSGGDILGMLRAGAPVGGVRPTDSHLEALALRAE